jgi:hypothetical protein
MHTREGWRVQRYLLHTGDVEPAVYRRNDEGMAIEYMRLLRADLVVTCAECYRRGDVRDQRLFPEERES